MQIEFTHPPTIDIDEVIALVEDPGITVRTSPHVGNLDQGNNPHYLALALSGVPLELVDTIVVADRNGRPGVFVSNGKESDIHHGLNKAGRKKFHPCAARVGHRSLTEVHTHPLVHQGIGFGLSSRFAGSVHPDLPAALMSAIDNSTLLRMAEDGVVSSDASKKKTPTESNIEEFGIYGQGEDPLNGIILPMETLSATEIIQAGLSGIERAVHVGGFDMVKYMKDPGMQAAICKIAQVALSALGIDVPAKVTYSVLNKNGGITGLSEASARLGAAIGVENFSQHDLHRLPAAFTI